MEKINKYKTILQTEMEYRAAIKSSNIPSLKRRLIVNATQSEFIIIKMGWHKKEFRHYTVFHIEIKTNGQVWIYENNTDVNMIERLEQQGILRSDITLGFLTPIEDNVTELVA